MLYKLVAMAAFLVCTDALKIDANMGRRSVVAKGAALGALAPLAAFAELKKAGDAEIYKRAECVPTSALDLHAQHPHAT